MIRLTGNELYKIFHKKILYIIVILAIGGTLFINITDKIISKNEYELETMANQNLLKIYEGEGDKTSPEYIDLKSSDEVLKIKKDKKVEPDSPLAYYIDTYVKGAYITYYSAGANPNYEINQEEAKSNLDDAIKRVDNFDWKYQINKDLEEYNAPDYCGDITDTKCEQIKQASIKAANYRLKHNIPYANNDASDVLMGYSTEYDQYLDVKDSNDDVLSYDKLYNKKQTEKSYKETEYLINNELIDNEYDNYNSGVELVEKFGHPSFFVIVALLALSASIVAEEFNKGTIKQLLVKPFARNRIIISKMLAVIITTVLLFFVLTISLTLINGAFRGDLNTLLKTDVIYNIKTNKVIEISYIKEALLSFVYALPQLVLLGIFTFAVSVLSTNTALSLGLGFGAYLSEEVFGILINKFNFLSYMPTVNYNLTPYMFGGMQTTKYLTLQKALLVDGISFVVLFILILIIFKKKDIKNQ